MKRIEVRTAHESPALVARAVSPDNTPEIRTRVKDGRVVTTIERETTGGLRTTADDYVVNLTVADEVAQLADQITNQS
ncbi:MAG: KEOPS complex subunit Pcc1 [Halalkalicoccus sp.]